MENNSKIDMFVSKLTRLVNDNDNGSGETEEKFFGKYDIAIWKFIGLLLAAIIVMFALRFVFQPSYWLLTDLFSMVSLAVLAYFFVIQKLLKKNNG